LFVSWAIQEMSSGDEDDESTQEPRERSASYAGSKTLELLGELGSAKHAGRIKALKRFQEYINQYRPELYDDDVELLYVVRVCARGIACYTAAVE
jgi:hypothetical protein